MYTCMHVFFNVDKDEEYRIAHVSIIVLGILTCGTSVLLWYLYKGIGRCGNNKKKYSLKGMYVCIYFSMCICTIARCSVIQTTVHVQNSETKFQISIFVWIRH